MDLGLAELAFPAHRYGMKKQEIGNQAMAYAKSRKATIGFVVSACLSVRIKHLGSHWVDFH
jgi:hypothetical protein